MIFNFRLLAAASVPALLAANAASAQMVTPSPVDLPRGDAISQDTIVVTANRTERAISQVGQSVTVIAEPEIIARQPSDALDVLRTVPGVTFTRNGGIGTNAGVSIRGADSDQTVVLIDGVKLNDPASTGGGFNFGPLLMGNIARVEVVRGSQSVLYGSQAIGGVVNLITRASGDEPAMFASAQYGSRDTVELVGNVSGRAGPVGASLGATYLRTDGISAFSEARGGSEKDGFESIGVNGKLDIALASNLSLDLRGFYADSEVGIDGFPAPLYAFADTLEISHREDFVGYAGLNAAFFDGRFRNRLGFAYTNIDRRNVDPSLEGETETFAAQGENRRFEYQAIVDAADFAELVFGAEREESEYDSAPNAADVAINSAYGQVNLTPVRGLSLTGGVRRDDHETFGGATTFAASGAYSPNAGATVLRASYGEGFKAPSLFQLYSDYGNGALLPERAESWDVGLTHSFLGNRAEVGVTYFERSSTNLIAFVSCFGNPVAICADRPSGTYDNIARASADGWEFGVALRPVDGFDVALNYSIVDAFDDMTGNRLARRARDKASLVLDYRTRGGIGLGATVLMVGDSFDNAANTRSLDGYVVSDIRASYALTDRLKLFGRVENLFDAEYETIFRYGQPGRMAFGGVRYRM
ncbi:TonB-dependent receptor [uncultured Croceicoccus sp.]|uniref:TonB-dependent receptor plug domain-containing protein n=1 Tax=uncultured Croceicoccus sp. TaxID=1295329 RepID=UPI002636E113|nr:TonB-dependent receptor [uncultured Croceicoccus sp.]